MYSQAMIAGHIECPCGVFSNEGTKKRYYFRTVYRLVGKDVTSHHPFLILQSTVVLYNDVQHGRTKMREHRLTRCGKRYAGKTSR